ncbi:MAG: hypothetical protein ACHQVK_04215, partial [Candidatus Paceibacterales bacterium]
SDSDTILIENHPSKNRTVLEAQEFEIPAAAGNKDNPVFRKSKASLSPLTAFPPYLKRILMTTRV